MAIVAPKHQPNSVPLIFLPNLISRSSPNSYPNRSRVYINVRSRHHSGRSSSSFMTSGFAPHRSSHRGRPSHTSRAVPARVDTVMGSGVEDASRGCRRS